MKTKLSILLIAVTLFSSFCFAQTIEREENSQLRRQTKKWVVTGQVLGLGPIPGTTSSGSAAGYFIEPDLIISVEAIGGKSLATFFDFFSYRQVRFNSTGVHLKSFLGNSFYVKGGVDYNRFSMDYSYSFLSSTGSHGFESEFVTSAVTIGNQWQFDHFTLGCDWFGWTAPISSRITSEYSTSASEKIALDDDESRFTKTGGAQALRFYLGFSW